MLTPRSVMSRPWLSRRRMVDRLCGSKTGEERATLSVPFQVPRSQESGTETGGPCVSAPDPRPRRVPRTSTPVISRTPARSRHYCPVYLRGRVVGTYDSYYSREGVLMGVWLRRLPAELSGF